MQYDIVPVSVRINPLLAQALALQSCSGNRSPVPDSVLWNLIFRCVSFSGGVFFSQTTVWYTTTMVLYDVLDYDVTLYDMVWYVTVIILLSRNGVDLRKWRIETTYGFQIERCNAVLYYYITWYAMLHNGTYHDIMWYDNMQYNVIWHDIACHVIA